MVLPSRYEPGAASPEGGLRDRGDGQRDQGGVALGLAQPALTAQLQRIERTLGGPLFDRDRRGARPTALGELVLARARVLLPAMKGLQDEAARLAGTGDRR